MELDKVLLHNLTLDLLYGALMLLTFVIIERLAYYIYLGIQARRLGRLTHRAGLTGSGDSEAKLHHLTSKDILSSSIRKYVDVQRLPGTTRGRIEDLSTALFLRVEGKINARLWVLDAIVTAAPLLGLLGTILGIMDTFNALSAGGISDPEAVSRGIGSALFATALGIATALYGLIGHSILYRQSEMISEEFKVFLLEATFDGPKVAMSTHSVSIDTRQASSVSAA